MANDDFDDLGVAPVAKFPTVAQLGSDGPKLKLVYGKGTDQEQIKDGAGRLVMWQPTKLEHNVKSNFEGNKPGDRMTVNIAVLDGPPIENVIDKDGDVVYTFPEPMVPNVNAEWSALYLSQTVVIGVLSKFLVNGENAPGKWNYGRLFKLPAKPGSTNKPWALGRAVDAKQAAADLALAKAWLKAHPEPEPFD